MHFLLKITAVLLLLLTLRAFAGNPSVTPIILDIREAVASKQPVLLDRSSSWKEVSAWLGKTRETFGADDPVLIRISDRTPFGALSKASEVTKQHHKVFWIHQTSAEPMALLDVIINPLPPEKWPKWMKASLFEPFSPAPIIPPVPRPR